MKMQTADLTPIGRVIVAAIETRMSREQLAFRAGMESGTLSKILRGVQPLGEARLVRIARVAEVTREEYERVWLPALEQTRREWKGRLRGGTAPEVARHALAATFRHDAPATEGLPMSRVSGTQDRDGGLAEAEDLRTMMKKMLTRQRALERRVTSLEADTSAGDRTLGKLRLAISPWPRRVAGAMSQPTVKGSLAMLPLAWGTDAPRGTATWMH